MSECLVGAEFCRARRGAEWHRRFLRRMIADALARGGRPDEVWMGFGGLRGLQGRRPE